MLSKPPPLLPTDVQNIIIFFIDTETLTHNGKHPNEHMDINTHTHTYTHTRTHIQYEREMNERSQIFFMFFKTFSGHLEKWGLTFLNTSKFSFLDLWKENFKPISTVGRVCPPRYLNSNYGPEHFPTEIRTEQKKGEFLGTCIVLFTFFRELSDQPP